MAEVTHPLSRHWLRPPSPGFVCNIPHWVNAAMLLQYYPIKSIEVCQYLFLLCFLLHQVLKVHSGDDDMVFWVIMCAQYNCAFSQFIFLLLPVGNLTCPTANRSFLPLLLLTKHHSNNHISAFLQHSNYFTGIQVILFVL